MASLLPGNRFSRSPDQCFKTRRRLLSRSGPDARNGLSLTRNGCSFRSPHSEVNVPGLLLRFQLAASAARSAFRLRYPIRLAPVWAASLLLARCSLHDLLEDRASSLHSPLGLLLPAGSKRSAGFAAFRPAFRTRPISLRSPPPVSIYCLTSTSVSAADHRSRSATFSEACCSSNLLEPSSLCSRSLFWSTSFCPRRYPFPQHLFALFLLCYNGSALHPLWINRHWKLLFLRY